MTVYRWLARSGGLFWFLAMASCTSQPNSSGVVSNSENLQPVQLLVLRLGNQGYTRSIDHNSYVIGYRAELPNTVVITVRYSKETDQSQLRLIIDSAKDMIKRKAEQDYHIKEVNIEVESSPLE